MKGNNWKALLFFSIAIAGILMLVFLVAAMAALSPLEGNTAHIKIRGIITTESEDSFLSSSTVSSESIIESLKRANSNPSIKAVLLDINSPGGSAVASEEVAAVVKDSKKPVIALIRDIGTSGAYWAASSADHIVASPLSITGSVGATASYLEFAGLFEKYGIGYERVVSGSYKDAGSPYRELREDEKVIFQEMIDQTGNYFAASVQENRHLSDSKMEQIRTARVYSGEQAMKLGLVDSLGGIDSAKKQVSAIAGIEEVRIVEYRTKEPFSLSSILAQQASTVGKSIGASLFSMERSLSLT